MEKPKKPGLSECCGGGSCCPCVWDVYFAELEKWQTAQKIKQPDAEVDQGKVDQGAEKTPNQPKWR